MNSARSNILSGVSFQNGAKPYAAKITAMTLSAASWAEIQFTPRLGWLAAFQDSNRLQKPSAYFLSPLLRAARTKAKSQPKREASQTSLTSTLPIPASDSIQW